MHVGFSGWTLPWPPLCSLTAVKQTASLKRRPATQSCVVTFQTSTSRRSTKVRRSYSFFFCKFWIYWRVFHRRSSSSSHLQRWRKPVIGSSPTTTQPGSDWVRLKEQVHAWSILAVFRLKTSGRRKLECTYVRTVSLGKTRILFSSFRFIFSRCGRLRVTTRGVCALSPPTPPPPDLFWNRKMLLRASNLDDGALVIVFSAEVTCTSPWKFLSGICFFDWWNWTKNKFSTALLFLPQVSGIRTLSVKNTLQIFQFFFIGHYAAWCLVSKILRDGLKIPAPLSSSSQLE